MRRLLILAVTLLLAACGSQQAGYQITDRNHSLSVTRDQSYPGGNWTNWLVVTRFPECQRRYALKDSSSESFKMDVYRPEPGVFILNHGRRWYIAETRTCRWQQYEEEPPEPGELVGTFKTKDDALVWEAAESRAAGKGAKRGE